MTGDGLPRDLQSGAAQATCEGRSRVECAYERGREALILVE